MKVFEQKVSIIVPVYNVEKYIERCILSIINQTHKNIEILLINDGSTDNSLKICQQYSKQDSRITVINKQNGGLSSARNAGLEKINGNYFTFIDSDDWIDARFIEIMLKNIDDCDIIQCNYERIDNNNKILFKNDFKSCVLYKNDILNSFFIERNYNTMACAKLYKTSKFKKFRFYEGKNNEDTIYVADYLNVVNKIKLINEYLYFYFYNSNSIMTSTITEKKVYDAYFSAYYMLDFCEKNASNYSMYMHKNLCEISISLYKQLKEHPLTNEIEKVVLNNFNDNFSKFYKNINKIHIPLIIKLKIILFKLNHNFAILIYKYIKKD